MIVDGSSIICLWKYGYQTQYPMSIDSPNCLGVIFVYIFSTWVTESFFVFSKRNLMNLPLLLISICICWRIVGGGIFAFFGATLLDDGIWHAGIGSSDSLCIGSIASRSFWLLLSWVYSGECIFFIREKHVSEPFLRTVFHDCSWNSAVIRVQSRAIVSFSQIAINREARNEVTCRSRWLTILLTWLAAGNSCMAHWEPCPICYHLWIRTLRTRSPLWLVVVSGGCLWCCCCEVNEFRSKVKGEIINSKETFSCFKSFAWTTHEAGWKESTVNVLIHLICSRIVNDRSDLRQ